MQHSPGRDGESPDVDAAFADPAFAEPKARGAPFAILRQDDGAVLWANVAAARHWGAEDPAGLAAILFGAGGRGGWLDGLMRGLVPGRAPRLARAGLGRGFAMQAHTALIRAWTAADGATLVGLAVPDGAVAPDRDAWRRPAWAPEPSAPDGDDLAAADVPVPEPDDAGPTLARRSQLAVLRDRLGRAVDGATALRLLWRTDAGGALGALDADTFARLGAPLRPDGRAWPDMVASFDPEGAERLRAALATRTTWAGITVALPVADGSATVPMVLSASPVIGPGRAFAGFRGFGILDLGDLALAARSAPVSAPQEPPGAGPAPGAAEADAALPAPMPDAVAPVAAPPEPPRAEPQLHANVVQLRAFQGTMSGRIGASPVPPFPEPDAAPSAGVPPPEEEGEPDARLDDQLAFLALGEALRARIGTPPGDDPAGAPEPEPAPAGSAVTAEVAAPVFDGLPVPIVAAADGRVVYANAAAAARFGYDGPRELLGSGEGPAVTAAGTGRIALDDAEGRPVPAAARGVAVLWGGVPATLWFLSEAEAEREAPSPQPRPAVPARDDPRCDEAEGRAAELLDRVDDAVALLDADGRVRRLNSRGELWFGRAGAEAALGRSVADLLAPESRSAALALLGEVRSERDGVAAPPLRREVAARAGEGATVLMLLTMGRLGTAGFYATLRDVTALKRAETDRARTERDHARAADRLPDLLAKVSHEIRTPLGAILGFAEVMMDERFGPLGNPRYRDYLKDIHASGTQVVALVDDLLDLSRIEAGQVELAVAAVDLNRVVAETVAEMQSEAHRGRVIMRTSLGGRLPAALVDERSARQIVRNLLSNAVKFNEPGGQVIVSTALGEAGAVLLRVRDTGVGMSDAEIAAALEPFGGLPARPPAGGNGLGLPLTRALVGANGADMTIRSRPREGTLVEVAFAPAASGEARRPA